MVFENLTGRLLQNANVTYITKDIYGYAIEALIFAFIFFTPAIICKFVGHHLITKRVQKPTTSMRAYEPLLHDDEYEDEHLMASQIECDIPFEELKEFMKEKKSSQPLWGRRFLVVSEILEIMVILCLAIIPSVLSSGGLISVAFGMFLTFIFLLFAGVMMMKSFCPREVKNLLKVKRFKNFRQSRPQTYKELYCAFKLEPAKCFAIAGFILLYTISVPLMTEKSCLAYYEPKTGAAYGAFYISTSFSRWISLPKVCPDGQICHIYSTLAEDASTSVILNVHTGIDVDSLEANYDTWKNFEEGNKGGLAMKKSGLDLKIDLDSTGSRYLHSIYLDNLEPATDYYVKFVSNGRQLGEANFTTFPNEKMQKNIVMVVGGDSSGNEVATAFIKDLRNYNPDVILVGGDIVYDNGDQDCYYCWDYYLNQFEALNKQRGKLIPLILAFGNHDVGLDDGQLLGVDPYQNNLMLFFPQHSNYDVKNPGIPKPEDRMSYFYKKIGNMLHVTLDTGYLSGYNGKQLTWLQNTAHKFPTLAKFANYHVPIVPACFYNPQEYGHDSRVHSWVPVFENNKFLTVFENHVHLFKRTFPLKLAGGEGPGVVYIGDGAWGINPEDCYNQDPNRNVTGVFDKMGNMNHIWILNISRETVEYNALGRDGKIFDTYSQKIADYV